MYFVRARQSHGISMDSIIAFFFFCHKVLLFPLLSVCFRDEFEVCSEGQTMPVPGTIRGCWHCCELRLVKQMCHITSLKGHLEEIQHQFKQLFKDFESQSVLPTSPKFCEMQSSFARLMDCKWLNWKMQYLVIMVHTSCNGERDQEYSSL